MRRIEKNNLSNIFFSVTLAFCAMLVITIVFLAVNHGSNDFLSFTEPVLTLSHNWEISDSEGSFHEISLPQAIDYGKDGIYTLRRTLPNMESSLTTPSFRFYSNYVDFSIVLDGRELYSFPSSEAAFSGATGNTYHFVRMPSNYAGKILSIELRCQLGSDITYLINPPLLGSKATMLNKDIMNSLPSFTLTSSMTLLAIGLSLLYFVFRQRLDLSNATLYTALFTFLFAVYMFFETSFAQVSMPNGYLLCYATLMLLAIVPMPLIGVFLDAVSSRFKPVMYGAMVLCAINVICQTILNFSGVMSVRVMLPATHFSIIVSIAAGSTCLFFSHKAEKPGARRSLLSAVPMIIGGVADIVLLNFNRPSLNNCFWFSIGVTVFIIYQLCGFVCNYFSFYRTSLQAKLLTEMAYRDVLSGIENRNAYERKLKELNKNTPNSSLCCIVADIDDLKIINDTLGHQSGDAAIRDVGSILCHLMPECASFYRTGGDEFVVLLEGFDEESTRSLSKRLSDEAVRQGKMRNIPISLSIGFGRYESDDGNIIDFIRRVDTLMYENKRKHKDARHALAEK